VKAFGIIRCADPGVRWHQGNLSHLDGDDIAVHLLDLYPQYFAFKRDGIRTVRMKKGLRGINQEIQPLVISLQLEKGGVARDSWQHFHCMHIYPPAVRGGRSNYGREEFVAR
jgi:hypothetical protein